MDSAGGPHVGILSMQTQVARKEWRVVAEGSARDRLSVDGPIEHSRVNGSARIRQPSGLHRENSRNGRMFHSGSSGNSSDSDHHTGDVGVQHGSVPHQDLGRQAGVQGDDNNIYDEIERLHHQADHLGSTLTGLTIESGVKSSSINPDETLEQRLNEVIRQKEELQHIEVELRAQFMARGEVMRLKNSFDEQVKQQASVVANLQEQLQEREQRIHHLEEQLEERERELHANKREANEAVNQVWAKDGLLREQTSELATLRRERENVLAEQKATRSQFEAERAQLLSQLQDLKEQVRDKEHQVQELDEQCRSTQTALIYKDEQLRDAQAWMQRAQELDAFHANAHNSLHAELRDRNDQIHQLWLGHQRQLAEVERYHAQTIQRLQLEVAEAREQNRSFKNAGSSNPTRSKEEQSALSNIKESGRVSVADQALGSATKISTPGLGIANNQAEHATGLPVVAGASPVLGVAPVLTSAQLPVLHQFAAQPQGMAPSIPTAPSQISQSALNQFSNPAIGQTQKQISAVHQQTIQHNSKQIQQPQLSQVQRYPHRQQVPAFGQPPGAKPPNAVHPRGGDQQQQKLQHERDHVGPDQGASLRNNALHLSQSPDVPAIQHPNIQLPVHQSQTGGHALNHESRPLSEHEIGDSLQVQTVHEEKHSAYVQMLPQQESQQQQLQIQQEVSAKQLHEQNGQGKLDNVQLLPQNIDLKTESSHCQINISSTGDQIMSGPWTPESQLLANVELSSNHGSSSQSLQNLSPATVQKTVVVEQGSQTSEPVLLDERSLLACLVRAIPLEPSARIKISTTLPNRLGKMLAPLHWHDYKKQYGRLDEFVGSHLELFIIDGDFIHLREGAHAIISATTTVAKVAAAAAAASPLGPSWSPTVAVTPVAQSQVQRLRKVVISPQVDVKPASVPPQAMNFHQEALFAEPHGNGDGSLTKGVVTRITAGEIYTAQNQQGSKPSGQRVMMVLGSRSEGLSLTANNVNGVDYEKARTANYGNSPAANRKNGVLFGSRQNVRTTVLKTGPFGKQDFITRPQTQENKISRSS